MASSGEGTSLLDLSPIVFQLLISRISSAKDVRSLLRCCKHTMKFRNDEDAQVAWVVRHHPQQGLLLAARAQNFSLACRLLALGLPGNTVDPRDKQTPLHWACKRLAKLPEFETSVTERQQQRLQQLLQRRFLRELLDDEDWRDNVCNGKRCWDPRHQYLQGLAAKESILYWTLRDWKVDACAKSSTGDTPLHEAARTNNVEALELLLRKAPLAMTLENADCKIPIEVANSHESLLALLPFPLKWLRAVKKKAVKKANYACSSLDKDVHAAAQHANRVLRHAWFWSCSNMGTEAIQSSAASRHRSHTEQCFSSEHGFTDTAGKQVLCELLSTYDVADPGSDFYFPPEDKNEEGDTALMLACKGGSDELVEMLLDAFPDQDLDVKDAKGRAVWHLVPMSRPSVIGLLQKADERQRRLLGEEGL